LVENNENHIAYRTTNDKTDETTTFLGKIIFELEIKEEVGLDTMIADGGFPSEKLSEKAENSFEVIATAIRGKKPKKRKSIGIDSNRRWLNQRALNKEDEEYVKKCKMRPAVEGLMDKIKPIR